jgi:hypothetical protein
MLVQRQTLSPYNRDQIAGELSRLSSERLDATELDRIYTAMIVHRAELYGADRLDANETMILEHQLEQMRARSVDVQRPEFKARRLVPVTSEIDPGAESWAYSVWDRAGMAKVIANYADDIPKVATFAKKYTHTIETIALGYEWSWLDLLRTARAGVPLRARKADAVRTGFEQKIEEIAAIGIKETGLTGLLNNANVPQINAAPPATGSSTAWGGADKKAPEVLADLLAMEDAIISTTKGVLSADTLVLPLAQYRYITRTPLYTTAPADPGDTILKVFLEQSETVRNVDWWHFAATADGGNPRAVMYPRNPSVVHLEIPQEQQELPPQSKNLSFEVNSVGRIGGVAFEYPLGAVYMDGI